MRLWKVGERVGRQMEGEWIIFLKPRNKGKFVEQLLEFLDPPIENLIENFANFSYGQL